MGLKYAIYCHKQSIQLQWGFVKAIKSHIQLYAAYTGLWGLLCASVYHIYTIQGHIEHILEDEETSGRLYLQYTPYTTVHSIYRALGPPLWVSMSHKKTQHIQGFGASSVGLYMSYTAICSTYWDVGPPPGDSICHTLQYTAHTGMWGLLRGTLYAIHCHIQHIQGCGACSGGLYMPYTAIYSTYRDVGPALGECISHTLPYTAYTGMWGLLWRNVYAIHCNTLPYTAYTGIWRLLLGTVYAIHCHIQHIQGCGPCSGGLYMPYTAIYSTYRDVGPALGDCICHILLYIADTGMWALLWGTVYAIHCHIQHIQGCGACSGGMYIPYTAIYSIYRDVGPPLGDCICHTLPYTAHTGMWGLLRGTLYAIHCHIQHIQGCGACFRGLYMPYTAIYSTYRDVGPALGECISHTLPYTAYTGMWGLLWRNVYAIHCNTLPYTAYTGIWRLLLGTVYAIHCHIQHIQGCGPCSGGLYMPYTAIYSTYRDVGPALGDCICHILLYIADTGMWALLWGTVYAIHCHIQHIQGCGACSGGMYIPYTAIYSIYRDVGPPLGDCICHTLPYTAHTGMWGLLRGTLYAIHCHIQHIQGCGACFRGLYMPYTAIYSRYRDVGPALEDFICHTLPYAAHTVM